MIKLTGDMAPENLITSKDNERLAAVRKVRDGKDRTRCFVEGVRLASEAVSSPVVIEACFVSESFEQGGKSPGLAERTFVVSDRVFPTITDTQNSQGIVLIVSRQVADLETIGVRLQTSLPVVIYLQQINNPSNIGAIFRTAEAAGAAGLIVSPGSVDAFSPKSLRASMGSAFRLPCVTNITLERAIEWSRQIGLTVAAADISGTTDHVRTDWRKPRLLVLGSEAHGLSQDVLSSTDDIIAIGMSPDVESLNIAVSTGIMLFEARRQFLAI